MKREQFEALVKFCATQFREFDASAWRASSTLEIRSLAIAARFLSLRPWFGHASDLIRVVEVIAPDLEDVSALILAAADCKFDFGRFSSALKMEISHAA